MTRWGSEVELIDHQGVEWDRVRRTRYWMDQRFVYRYPGRVRELRQRLIVVPPDVYGDQRLAGFHLHVSEPSATTRSTLDAFGNRVLQVHVPYVEEEVTFETRLIVERRLEGRQWPRVTTAEALPFRAETALTGGEPEIEAVARQLVARHSEPEEFAEAVNAWVYQSMRYGHGWTDVRTTAAEALQIGQGLCQDYAHIMLAICRAAGLPARYVSGHMLGEGGSHAWVEVLLWDAYGSYVAVAFDPTHDRRSTAAYITVAVGRDFRDVSPTTGSFIAPHTGHLTASKRAGLTDLEYR
ncbi:MAG: transglutaminase family protein [Gemmatimonadota bacterium]